MKTYINHIIKLCILILGISLNAQRYPVQVTQTILPPYSSKLSDYVTASNVKFRLDVLLTDVVASNRQVRLKLRIKGNGLDIQSRDIVAGAPLVFLNGGVLQQFTNLDLSAYFQPNNLIGISPQQYNRPLPEGMYTVCWEVHDVITNQQINNPVTGCSNIFLLLNDPPFLNLPYKGDQLVAKDPMNIIFQWTPRHTNATNVSYEFELREIWDNNIDPQAGFLASPNYYSETVNTTTLLYDISKPVLLPKKKYGWRVRAKSLSGISENAIFKNDGYSEVFYFTYTNKCDAPTFVLSEALSSNGVKITWQGNFEHKKYHVQYKREDIADAEWFDVYTYNSQAQIANLKEGKKYLFRVGGSCNELNDSELTYSYSNVSQFTMPNKEDVATYNCGIIPEIEIKDTELLKNLGVNETFTAGDFPVTVKGIQGGNGVYSGKGFIVVPYLADTKIAVTFSSIKINDDYQLVDGVIRTTYDPTWGGVSDVNDMAVGGDGNSEAITVDFVIEDVKVDPNGDIIVIGSNGEIVELPGGEDQVITDSNGETWSVDEEGNVTKTGQVAEGGASNPQNTNGVNNQGEATAITAEGVEVTFTKAENSRYGFDAYNKSEKGTKDLYKKLNDDYFIPYKAVAQGKTETIIANLDITDAKIKPEDIIFKTKDGVAITKIDSTSTSYTLELKGAFTDAAIETQALVKQKEKYEIAGAFIQYQAKIKEVDVVLVNTANSNTNKIKEELQSIYSQALVKLNIKEVNDFTNDLESLVTDNTIESGKSGFGAQYTLQQREINNVLKSRTDFNKSAYYLILTNKKPSTKEEKGLMPLGRQFGYVYLNNGADEHTVAHELGHGAFQLKHPFSTKSYGFSEKETNWLLDYKGGDKIPYVHWKEIHNPKLRIGLFDGDGDAQSVTTSMPIALSINKKKYNGKYYYGYLTPSGERIILSQDYRPIFFHGIANDTYTKVVPGTLIGFKKKFKNFDGKIEEIKYRATIVNDEFLGYNDFTYKKPEIKDDKEKSFVIGLPYGEPDVDNGHWKNYKFRGKNVSEYKGQDKNILDITSDELQNIGLFNNLESLEAIKYLNPKKILGEGQIQITEREIKLLSGYYNSDGAQWFADLLANAGRDTYTISHNERREVFLIIKIAEIYNRYPKIFKEFTKFFNNWDLHGPSISIGGEWDKKNTLGKPTEQYEIWKKNLNLKDSNNELYDFYQQFLIELLEFVNKGAAENIACLSADFESKTNEELYECISRASEYELKGLPVAKQITAIRKILLTSKSGGGISDDKEIEVARILEAISKKKSSYDIALDSLETKKIKYKWTVYTNNMSHEMEDTLPLWHALFNNVEDQILMFGEDNRQNIVKSIWKIFIGSKKFEKQLKNSLDPEVLKSMTFTDLKSIHDNLFTYENDYQNIFRRGWSDIAASNSSVPGISLYDAEDFYKSVDTKITDDNLINAKQKIKWGLFNSETKKEENLKPFELVSFINISKNNLLKSFTTKDEKGNPQAIFIPAFTLHYASKTDALHTKSDIIQTAVDLLAFLPSGGTASLNTFGKFVYYADKISSMSSIAGTAFRDADPSLSNYMNQLSLVAGVASLGSLTDVFKKDFTKINKLVDITEPDTKLSKLMHSDVLKPTNNQVENVNKFAEKIIKQEFDVVKLTKEQIDATKEILENEIKYLKDFPDFKLARVKEAIKKVDELGLEKLNITSVSVVDASIVSKPQVKKALSEFNKENKDGFIDIVIHGDENKFVLDLPNGVQELENTNLVNYLTDKSSPYFKERNFRLLTCGNLDLAKEFARLLPEGYTVRATDDIVRIHADGGVTTIPRGADNPPNQWKDFKRKSDGSLDESIATKSPGAPKASSIDNFIQLGGKKSLYKNVRIVPEGKPYPEDFIDIKISELTTIHPTPRKSQPKAVEKYTKEIREAGFKVVEPGGVTNPVRVVRLPDGTEIVMDGMHRVEAMKTGLKETHIPVLHTTYDDLYKAVVDKGMSQTLVENVYYALHIGKRTGYYKGNWMPEIPWLKNWKRNEILDEVNEFMKSEFPDLADLEEGLLNSLKEVVPTNELKKIFESEFKGNLTKLKEFLKEPNLIDAWVIEKNVFKKNIGAFPENLDFTGYNFNTGDEFIDIIIHSNSKGEFVIKIEGTEKIVPTKQLAELIDKIPSDKKIRLLSCNTDKAAIEFSKVTKKPFHASDGVVDLYTDGTVVHDTPFKKYHKGARSDLEEDLIKPNSEKGTGKPLQLGRKAEHISEDLKSLFGNRSNNIFDKIKDLEIINTRLDRLLKDLKELDKNSVKAIGEKPELIDAWAVLDDIYLVNLEKKAIRKNISVLEEVEEHVSAGGGYKAWIATNAGKNKRLWTEVKLSAEFNFQKNKARNCMIKLFGGEEIGVARVEYSGAEKMLEFDVSIPEYLQSQSITSTFIKESITTYPNATVIKDEYIASSRYDGGEPATLTTFKRELAKPRVTEQDAAFLTQSGRVYKKNGFNGTPDILVNTPDRVVIKYSLGNSNFIPIDKARKKVREASFHVLKIDKGLDGDFEKKRITRNDETLDIEGFSGGHTQNALIDFVEKNGGKYAIFSRKGTENGVYEGIPVLSLNDKHYVKVNGIYKRYVGAKSNEVGAISSFFPDHMTNKEIIEEATYALNNNHGIVFNRNEDKLIYGFSRDGKIEIRFKLRSDGTVKTFFPKINLNEIKPLRKIGDLTSDINSSNNFFEVLGNNSTVIREKINELGLPDNGRQFLDDFSEASKEVIEEIGKNPKLIESWALMNNVKSPNRTDIDFLKFFQNPDAVFSRSEVLKKRVRLSEIYPKVSLEELSTIHYYTKAYGFEALNKALRGLGTMTDELIVFKNVLEKSLKKMPQYSKTTYRGAKMDKNSLKRYKNAYKNQGVVEEKGFMSTTKEKFIVDAFLNNGEEKNEVRVLFTIEGKSGLDIENASGHDPTFTFSNNESEVLFINGTEFKVINFKNTVDKKLKKLTLITLTDDLTRVVNSTNKADLILNFFKKHLKTFPSNKDFTGYNFKTDDSYYDIIIHTNDKGDFIVKSEGIEKAISIEELATSINKVSTTQKIRLLSCNDEKAAIELSKITDKPIYASDGSVKIYEDGTIVNIKPFKSYHKGIRGDLDEIPIQTKEGKGTYIELGLFKRKSLKELVEKEILNFDASSYHDIIRRIFEKSKNDQDYVKLAKMLGIYKGFKGKKISKTGIDYSKNYSSLPNKLTEIDIASEVRYIKDLNKRKEYEVYVKNGKLYRDGKELSKIKNPLGGKIIFILDKYGDIYAGIGLIGTFHHSSFLAGANIITGGEFKFKSKQGLEINNESQHYLPTTKSLGSIIEELSSRGFDIRKIKINENLAPALSTATQNFSSLFGDNSEGIIEKVKELGFSKEEIKYFIDGYSNTSKEILNEIGNDPTIMESWKALYDIKKNEFSKDNLEELNAVGEVLKELGGYKTWKASDLGKRNRLWSRIEGNYLQDVIYGNERKTQVCVMKLDEINVLSLAVKVPKFLRRQGITSKVFEKIINKHNPTEIQSIWMKDFFYEEDSTNLIVYKELLKTMTKEKAVFKTPSGILARKNGFTGKPVFLTNETDLVEVIFTKPENTIRTEIREIFNTQTVSLYKNVSKIIEKVEKFETREAESFIKYFKKVSKKVIEEIINTPELIEFWKIFNDNKKLSLGIEESLTVILKASKRFSYENDLGLEALKNVFNSTIKNKQAAIVDGLEKVEEIFNKSIPITITLTTSNKFVTVLDKEANKVCIFYLASTISEKQVLVNGKKIGEFKGIEILQKGDKIGFREEKYKGLITQINKVLGNPIDKEVKEFLLKKLNDDGKRNPVLIEFIHNSIMNSDRLNLARIQGMDNTIKGRLVENTNQNYSDNYELIPNRYSGEDKGLFPKYKDIEYLDEERRKAYEVFIKDGELILNDGKKLSEKGDVIFTMDGKGKIYAGVPIEGVLHHSSFTKGDKVITAGTIKFLDKGIEVSVRSGHYFPDVKTLKALIEELTSRGFDFNKIFIDTTILTSF